MADLPLDPFGRTVVPAGFTREDRVRLVGEAAEALLHGRLPDAPARLFLAGAVVGWLQRGGSLEGDFLRTTAPAGSHRTAAWLWAASSRGGTAGDNAGTVPTLNQTLEL